MDESSKQLLKKYQFILLPAAAALIAVVILGLVIVPQALQIPKNNTDISGEKTKLNKLTKKVGDLDALDTTQVQSDSDTALVALPASKDYPGAFGQALLLLQSSGLQIVDAKFSTQPTEGPAKSYTVRLEVSGNADQMNSFVEKIKNAPRLMKIMDFSISPSTQANSNLLDGELTIATYFKDLTIKAGTATDDLPTLKSDDHSELDLIKSRISQMPTATDAAVPVGKDNPFAR